LTAAKYFIFFYITGEGDELENKKKTVADPNGTDEYTSGAGAGPSGRFR
jgi:hypothetical protein